MFEKAKDTKAAAKDAEKLLESEYPTVNPKERAKLIGIFVKNFKRFYDRQKRDLIQDTKEPPNLGPNGLTKFDNSVLEIFDPSSTFTCADLQGLLNFLIARKYRGGRVSSEEEAEKLGEIFGYVFAGFEYGLASQYFLAVKSDRERQKIYTTLLGWIDNFAKLLKKFNPRIKPKFLGRRINKIILHGKLSREDQVKFISEAIALLES